MMNRKKRTIMNTQQATLSYDEWVKQFRVSSVFNAKSIQKRVEHEDIEMWKERYLSSIQFEPKKPNLFGKLKKILSLA